MTKQIEYYKKHMKEAKQIYNVVKALNPLNSKFKGSDELLKKIVLNAASGEVYLFLKNQNLVNTKDIDGLLDFLYGLKTFNVMGNILPEDKLYKLIKEIEKHVE